ncbi:MAG: NAD(+) synthase, partial [Oscillospiraceae bacterium]|nr:NAD(+) synthase [Oscillospiraceae bacterium]
MSYGFIKAAALSPRVTVASPKQNGEETLKALLAAAEQGVQLAVLPELGLSAYTCADLFHQDALIRGCEEALSVLLKQTAGLELVYAVGLPVRLGCGLYNCAALCRKGRILGVVPKTYLPNYQEYYEKRWFMSGGDIPRQEITLCGQQVPFGEMLFRFGELVVGIELCEDLWVPVPPSSSLCLAGANVILNLSASNELVAKNDYRRSLIARQSGGCICGYLYASAGVGESTTDMVFSGACTIGENGSILAENQRFEWNGSGVTACIDLEKLMAERRKNGSFADNVRQMNVQPLPVVEGTLSDLPESRIDRYFDPAPFIPGDPRTRDERCREIFAIQAAGLAKRLSHTGLKRPVIGISGGLDSTLALLVAKEAMKLLGYPGSNILAVTMPGFGTTDQTYQNALELIDSLGAELMEIDIRPACLQHMQDIGHDPDLHDITYENTQARQRTYLLMDLANKHGGILVGTGDLSELAMGWCTYNADHMSMYGVNASVPKTLVRHLVAYVAGQSEERTAAVLRRVLDTPVSPELLPPDEQ